MEKGKKRAFYNKSVIMKVSAIVQNLSVTIQIQKIFYNQFISKEPKNM